MMNVLDMLKYRLAPGDRTPFDPMEQEMMRFGQQRLPPGLPLGVQDSIRNRPSYGEGEIMAPQRWWIPALGGQVQKQGPQREERLLLDRGEAIGTSPVPPGLRDLPEGGVWSSRPSWESPYASPLNQLMQLGRKAPLSMY
jgi:hypothetical protein